MSKTAEAVIGFEGHTPRVVADLRDVNFGIEYVRDDIEGRYSDDDLEDAYKLVMANQVTGDDFKKLVGEDQYNAQTLIFDSIIVFLFPSDRYQGVFASFDYSDDFPVTELVDEVSAVTND